MNMYIGFDNGVSGGIAAISASHGKLISSCPMPISKARKGNEIDVRAVHLWITETTGGNLSNATYIIEEPGGSKSSKAACSMAGSFHAIRALLDVKFLRWHRVTPQAWQKEMLPGCATGDTKPRALAKARQLWPEETWLASSRCKVAHDGMTDAALIAEYARIKNL